MLAYALLEAEGTPQMMEQTLKTSLEAQLKAAPELLAYRQAFEMYLRNTISFEAQKEELARIYLEVYAPDEIRELIRFYQTPIGRKKAAAGSGSPRRRRRSPRRRCRSICLSSSSSWNRCRRRN